MGGAAAAAAVATPVGLEVDARVGVEVPALDLMAYDEAVGGRETYWLDRDVDLVFFPNHPFFFSSSSRTTILSSSKSGS
jgi:hypothetical protein